MRKSILFLFVFLVSITMVFGIAYKYQSQSTPTSYNSTFSDYGSGWGKQSYTNITDGSYTTFAETSVNASRLYLNYTDWVESTNVTIEVTYNRTGTKTYSNDTTGSCFNSSFGQVQVLAISNNTQNFSTLVTDEAFTWVNGTAVALAHTRVVDYTVFNSTKGLIKSGNYTLDYLNGSITLTSNFNSGVVNYINYTYMTDDIPRSRAFCRETSTTWKELYSTDGSDEIYDVRVYWYIPAKDYTFTYTLVEPDEYATSTSTSMNFNITASWTGSDLSTTLNCSLYTRFNNTMGYRVNSSAYTLINNSHVNTTRLFGDKGRYWWFWSCEDNNSREIQNTTTRIFDVDTTYSQLSIGANQVINMSITTGNIVTMGSLTTSAGIILNQNSTGMTCSATTKGTIYYDGSTNHHYGCNSTDWLALY